MTYFLVKTKQIVTETLRIRADSKEDALARVLNGDGDIEDCLSNDPEATIDDVTEEDSEEEEPE